MKTICQPEAQAGKASLAPPRRYSVKTRTMAYESTAERADGLTSVSCPASDTGMKPTGTITCSAHKEQPVEL